MKLNTLQLENYRNYDEVTLKCHPDVNILIGETTRNKIYLSIICGLAKKVIERVIIRNLERLIHHAKIG